MLKMFPFIRYLKCPNCNFEDLLSNIYYNLSCKFRWRDFKFYAVCPNCKYEGEWLCIDRPRVVEKYGELRTFTNPSLGVPHESRG